VAGGKYIMSTRTVFLVKYCLGDHIKVNMMDGSCGTHGTDKKYTVRVTKPEENIA
jgi:hypothetical protein